MLSAWPNPANEKVSIGFNHGADGFVQLSVYDMQGRKVKDLVSKTMEKGSHTIEWNLTDQGGGRVVRGVYFARLSDADMVKSTKIIVY